MPGLDICGGSGTPHLHQHVRGGAGLGAAVGAITDILEQLDDVHERKTPCAAAESVATAHTPGRLENAGTDELPQHLGQVASSSSTILLAGGSMSSPPQR